MKRWIVEGFEVKIVKTSGDRSLVQWRSGYRAWIRTSAIKEAPQCLN